MMLAPPVAGRLAGNLPAFVIIGAGFLVLAGSCWLLAGAGILTTFWVMAALIAFGRIGLSSSIPAQNLATMEAVPRELAAYASGTMNFIRIVGAAIGVNVLAILLESRISQHGSELLISQTADNFVSSDLRSTLAEYLAVTGLPIEGRSVIAMEYLRDALSLKAHELAFQDGHIALALFFLAGAGATVLLLRRS